MRDGASSITWAAHAEIDGSTCIRDNAPCRTGSFGRLTFFHAAPRIAPLITNTVSCLCPPFPPPLPLPPPPFPPSHPARSTSFTRERRAPARAPPPLPSPLLLRRFRRTCPSRSSDSIAPPTPRLKKFEHRRPRCFGRGEREREGEGGRRRGRGYGGFFRERFFEKRFFDQRESIVRDTCSRTSRQILSSILAEIYCTTFHIIPVWSYPHKDRENGEKSKKLVSPLPLPLLV